VGVLAFLLERGAGKVRTRTIAIRTPQINKKMNPATLIDLPFQLKAFMSVKRFTRVNAYLRLFPNYDEVQLLSIAILIGLEPSLALGTECDMVGDHSIFRHSADRFEKRRING
jgi:hypothetical protein